MADPKLVLEAEEDDDILLDSIAPPSDEIEGPTLALGSSELREIPTKEEPPQSSGSAPARVPRPAAVLPPSPPGVRTPTPLARPEFGAGSALGSRARASGSSPGFRPLGSPPPPPPSHTKNPKPEAPSRPGAARPASPVLQSAPRDLQTVPAPAQRPRREPPKKPVPSAMASDRSSVTARDAGVARGLVGPGAARDGSQAAPIPLVAPVTAPPIPGPRSAVTPPASTPSGASLSSPAVVYHSGNSLEAYRDQSALMRLMAPFIEDPRPRWLLAGYFLVGVGLGISAAFGLWG